MRSAAAACGGVLLGGCLGMMLATLARPPSTVCPVPAAPVAAVAHARDAAAALGAEVAAGAPVAGGPTEPPGGARNETAELRMASLEHWREHMWAAWRRAKFQKLHAQTGCSDAAVVLPYLTREARLARCRMDGGTGARPLLVLDVGANVGAFANEVMSALGDLSVRFEHRSSKDVCRRPAHSLPAPLDVVFVEGNPPTCEVLAKHVRRLYGTDPAELSPPEPGAHGVSGSVRRWTNVLDDAGQQGAGSGHATLACVAAAEEDGLIRWTVPDDATGGAGSEFNVGLSGVTVIAPNVRTRVVNVTGRTVTSLVRSLGRDDSSGETRTLLRKYQRHPWCSGLEDARRPASAPRKAEAYPAVRLARGAARRVFLLKVDAEGADGIVLRGARPLLRAHEVDFLIFEYNSIWPGRERPLSRALHPVLDAGYDCAMVGIAGMVPLGGAWWARGWDAHSHLMFSNVFCALRRRAFVAIVTAYNARGPFDVLDWPAGLLEWGLAQPRADAVGMRLAQERQHAPQSTRV